MSRKKHCPTPTSVRLCLTPARSAQLSTTDCCVLQSLLTAEYVSTLKFDVDESLVQLSEPCYQGLLASGIGPCLGECYVQRLAV